VAKLQGRDVAVLESKLYLTMIPRHFTDNDYLTIAQAVLDAKYPNRCDFGDYEKINLSDPIPGVEITVKHWEDGHWAFGGSDDYGRREPLWEVDKHHYTVDSFEFFDNDGNDMQHDFNADAFVRTLVLDLPYCTISELSN
jgi:hypothetical protein